MWPWAARFNCMVEDHFEVHEKDLTFYEAERIAESLNLAEEIMSS